MSKVDTRDYRIKMSSEGYEALTDLATRQDRPMANIIREALENHLRQNGYSVSLDVNRGGFRHGAGRPSRAQDTADQHDLDEG